MIAISINDLTLWGCPKCGYRSGYSPISGYGGIIWQCGECNEGCVALCDGITVSPYGFGENSVRPTLQPHPRQGIVAHGRPDKRPEQGGDFFNSRGIGLEWSLTCFCCGATCRDGTTGEGYLNNIAAFVQCKAAGERVVAMFKRGARLDYREREPDRVQVKVGACDKHLPNLEHLNTDVRDGVITQEKIKTAIEFSEKHNVVAC